MVNKGTYIKPWTRQRELQKRYKEGEVPSIDELVNITNKIVHRSKKWQTNNGTYTLRNRALFILYYLTACRVSEMVICKKLRKREMIKTISFDSNGLRVVKYEVGEGGKPKVRHKKIDHNFNGITRGDIQFGDINGKKVM